MSIECEQLYVSPWFDELISNLINIPLSDNTIKVDTYIGYGKKDHNDKYCSFHKFTTPKNEFNFTDLPEIDVDKQKLKLEKMLAKAIQTLETKNQINDDEKKLKTQIKSLTTKYKKKESNIKMVTKCKQYRFFPTNNQKKILHKWFENCKKVYDFCVNKYKTDPSLFCKKYTEIKIGIFTEMFGDSDKGTPYDILTDEVRIFCSNLKSCKTNLENGHIAEFSFGEKKTKLGQCIFIPKTAVKQGSIYVTHLGKMKGLEKLDVSKITNDCRIIYSTVNDKYTLLTPINVRIKDKLTREPVIAIDPGEKNFVSFYGLNEYGQIGIDLREKILKLQEKANKFQKILVKKANKKGKIMRNRSLMKIQKKINRANKKIRDIVNDLHRKAALFLCKNYDRILIPEFKTQNMISAEKFGCAKKKVKETFEKQGKEEGIVELKKYKKRKRMNKKVKYVLNKLSHYRFRQHLINKCNEYGCDLKVITEEFTSKTCTNCGKQSNKYVKREKECESCGYKIDRDINGSRNILVKNIKEVLANTEKTEKIIPNTKKVDANSETTKKVILNIEKTKNVIMKTKIQKDSGVEDKKELKQKKTGQGKIIVKGKKAKDSDLSTINKSTKNVQKGETVKKQGKTIVVKGKKSSKAIVSEASVMPKNLL